MFIRTFTLPLFTVCLTGFDTCRSCCFALVPTLSFLSVSSPGAASLLLCQLWALQGRGQEIEPGRCSINKQMNKE